MCFFRSSIKRGMGWPQAFAALERATPLIEGELETVGTGRAGVLVRPTPEQTAEALTAELERASAQREPDAARVQVSTDAQGFGWLTVEAQGVAGVAQALAGLGPVLEATGLLPRVLAVAVPLEWKGRKLYWLYQPRIKAFTPFVPDPAAGEQERDHALEVRMASATRKAIPVHGDVHEWYPVWDAPL
jgi:hypothetical protein